MLSHAVSIHVTEYHARVREEERQSLATLDCLARPRPTETPTEMNRWISAEHLVRVDIEIVCLPISGLQLNAAIPRVPSWDCHS